MVAAGDPVLSSDITTLEDYTTSKPIGRLVQTVAQSVTSGAALAGITFTTEDIDTHGFHDTAVNNTRVTPTVAGYYLVTAGLAMTGRTDYTNIEISVARNGTGLASATRITPGAINQTQVLQATALVTCNGTTDYFEAVVRQANSAAAAANTAVSVQFSSSLTWTFQRPL